MKTNLISFVLRVTVFTVLSFLLFSCQPQGVSNNSNTNHLDEYIKIKNEEEANKVRNTNYSNLSTNELEKRLKEGVKNVK